MARANGEVIRRQLEQEVGGPVRWRWVAEEPGDIGWWIAELPDGRVAWGDDTAPGMDRIFAAADRRSALLMVRGEMLFVVLDEVIQDQTDGRYRAHCPRCGRALRAQDVDQAQFRILFGPCPDHLNRGPVAVDLRPLATDLGWRCDPILWEEESS